MQSVPRDVVKLILERLEPVDYIRALESSPLFPKDERQYEQNKEIYLLKKKIREREESLRGTLNSLKDVFTRPKPAADGNEVPQEEPANPLLTFGQSDMVGRLIGSESFFNIMSSMMTQLEDKLEGQGGFSIGDLVGNITNMMKDNQDIHNLLDEVKDVPAPLPEALADGIQAGFEVTRDTEAAPGSLEWFYEAGRRIAEEENAANNNEEEENAANDNANDNEEAEKN